MLNEPKKRKKAGPPAREPKKEKACSRQKKNKNKRMGRGTKPTKEFFSEMADRWRASAREEDPMNFVLMRTPSEPVGPAR
jgi:hypothetical protein